MTVAPRPGVVDVLESSCHLAALVSQASRARSFRLTTEIQDAVEILTRQCAESGLLDRYRKQAGALECSG